MKYRQHTVKQKWMRMPEHEERRLKIEIEEIEVRTC